MEFQIAAQDKSLNSEMFHKETGYHLYTRDGVLYVSGCQTQEEADALIAAHNPA